MSDRTTLFSGIQSTGNIHIGNYAGALRNWVTLQETYDTVYCVVDLHSITAPYDPADLRRARLETAKVLMAIGIDPERSLVYYQSDVPQHVELCWILGTLTSMGSLNRMTQFKEKSEKEGQLFGLFAYPVLQAADILIHKAGVVPVGDDQSQHLELTREIASRFNHRFGDLFPVPERITPEIGARVMSLQEPTAKMSKSDLDTLATVRVADSSDDIVRKFKRAVTDSGHEVRHDPAAKPGISNLLEILSAFTGRAVDALADDYHDTPYGDFKLVVADAVSQALAPFRSAYQALDDDMVGEVMANGASEALERVEPTMAEVLSVTGLA